VSRIRKILELSTDHLPPHLCDSLASIDHVVAYNLVTGWLLWVPDDPEASSAAMDVPIPDEILAVQQHARGLDCDYVLLHADADPDEQLPTWAR
jgi:hypothetical protein